jgi:hypothetical protein
MTQALAALAALAFFSMLACSSPKRSTELDMSSYRRIGGVYFSKGIDSATAELILARFNLDDKSGKIRVDFNPSPAGGEYHVNITDPPYPGDRKIGWQNILEQLYLVLAQVLLVIILTVVLM